ncbi:MAG: TonB-dependent receptor [Flavobacteriaceae bacterium]|nr:TonB-dependent receptor [Flavobacteriaceae bacterium]
MKFIFSLVLVSFISFNFYGQNELSGTITDKNDASILATIYIPQLEKGTTSNMDGIYSISNLPSGTYTIIYTSLGFASKSIKLSFGKDTSLIQDLVLKESAIEMEEVILSTPFHKLQTDNVMKVERITTNSLITSGAVNLSQGISNIPGVSTISTGNGIGKPVIRGLSSNRVLVYAQGVRLENQQFGDEHGLGISGSGIESVEVIKGPASLLYGSDALGGVLYLNPERFASSSEINVDGSSSYFSNTRGINSTLGVKASGERFKFIIRGGHTNHADYKTGDDVRVSNSRYNEYDLKSGVRFQNAAWKSTVRYNYNKASIGIPEEIGEQTTSRKLSLPFQKIDNHILSWNNTIFFAKSSADVKVGYLHNDRREFEETVNDADLRLKLRTFNYDLKYNLPDWGKFETIVGMQGMFQNNKNFGAEILIPNADKTDLGIFVTSHYHLDKVDLQAGIRWDTRSITTEAAGDPSNFDFIPILDKDFTSFNAALGAKADLSEQFLVRLNLATGFRAPNLAELTSNGVHEGTNRYEIGNANLNNEQNVQLDLSLEFRNEHFEIFANGFYNGIDSYIFITPTDQVIETNLVFNYVQSDAFLYGGELSFHLHPHPLDWLHLESSFETVTGELKGDGYLPLIPANNLRNTLRFEFVDGTLLTNNFAFITFENTFNQSNNSDFETPTKAYSLLSIGTETQIEFDKIKVKIGFSTTNLTNKSYIAHLSRLKMDGIANMGRSYNFNIKLEI